MRSADIEGMRRELASSGMRERDPEAYRQRAFELSVAGYFADPHKSHDLTPFRVTGRVQQSVWDSLGDFDLLAPGQMDTVEVPTLVVHGRQDPIPVASSEGIARALGARLVILDGSGHVPYVETPGPLFTTVDSFLAICP
jgi:pimeloyl-ACP methyl ester carboxylesterase